MELNDYQEQSLRFDLFPGGNADAPASVNMLVPLMGLVGEAGALVADYKKMLRDPGHGSLHRSLMLEELGDLMWYVAVLASRYGLSLNEVAQNNILKCKNRWCPTTGVPTIIPREYDHVFDPDQRLPETFRIQMSMKDCKLVVEDDAGRPLGDPLTDNNAAEDDGYRYHDVMHFAFVAVLGWSPVARRHLFNCRKRVSMPPHFDEATEDGGRAKVIDEALVALAYDHWKRKGHPPGDAWIDYELLRAMKRLTEHLEVRTRSFADWRSAVGQGFKAWHGLRHNNGGWIIGNQIDATLVYSSA